MTADNANTLDGLDSTAFLRSNANDSASGVITLRGSGRNRLLIQNSANGNGAGINFSDQSTPTQTGTIYYVHSDGDSFGAGNAFIVEGTESALTFYVAGNIKATNEITAYYSDERLKNFKGKITNALDKVLALSGYYFTENETAKSLGYDNDNVQIGVNAQEVQKVLPEIVEIAPISYQPEAKEEYLTVKYDKLAPVLIEAIKEQDAKIEAQAAEIAELKAMVQKLLDK